VSVPKLLIFVNEDFIGLESSVIESFCFGWRIKLTRNLFNEIIEIVSKFM